ncbi:hypothetical protein EDD21DRAFT_390972 [Dissophora ornata]|nr:hypothetical protein EDD21DRAFT_390972 [Dissophora ornata]
MDIAASSSSPSPSVSPRSYYAQLQPQPQPLHGQVQTAVSGSGGRDDDYDGLNGPLYRDPTLTTNNSIHGSSNSIWSSHSMPSSPILSTSPTMRDMWGEGDREEEDEEEFDGPLDAQAARTILLLASSPTRPPARTLNPEASAAMMRTVTVKDPWMSLQGAAGTSTGVPYLPMTSSPLVRFQTVSSTTSAAGGGDGGYDDDDDDDDANPFLVHKKRIPKVRAMTPDMEEEMTAVTATLHTPQRVHEEGLFGIQTPPPSGSQLTNRSNPGLLVHPSHAQSPSRPTAQSIAARRRGSGLTGGPGVDLLTMFPIPGRSPDETK